MFIRTSGKEFREWLKQNYPESYEIVSDKVKAKKYAKDIIEIIKGNNIQVKGVCMYYPKIMTVK